MPSPLTDEQRAESKAVRKNKEKQRRARREARSMLGELQGTIKKYLANQALVVERPAWYFTTASTQPDWYQEYTQLVLQLTVSSLINDPEILQAVDTARRQASWSSWNAEHELYTLLKARQVGAPREWIEAWT